MNWIFQETGIINQYKEGLHFGTQPIRVLHEMNLFMFQNTNQNFINELTEAFDKYGFSNTINIVYGENPIKRTPYIKNDIKAIYLDETFLSYLWCISHSIYTIYIQTVEYPRANKTVGYAKHEISQCKIDKANEIFNYAKFIIKDFYKWDIDHMPNPEKYLAEDRDFIEQPSIFYTEAIKFILCHEYIHAIKHIDKIDINEYEESNFIEFEIEADYEAIELIKKGIFPSKENELAVHIGITIGLLSMFFFKQTTTQSKHPNKEDRFVTALDQLNLSENTPCWGIAIIGLKLWSEQFGLNLQFNLSLNDKEIFFQIIAQIKNKII
jgi:hypothetical protein